MKNRLRQEVATSMAKGATERWTPAQPRPPATKIKPRDADMFLPILADEPTMRAAARAESVVVQTRWASREASRTPVSP